MAMLNKKSFIAYIQSIYPVTAEKAMEISYGFKPVLFPKNRLLIEENRVNRHSFFLEEGCVRSFVTDSEGVEVTTDIFSPPCFVNDFTAFFTEQPASENYETLCECTGWIMSHDEVENKFHNSVEFREFGRLLILDSYSRLRSRMLSLARESAEVRYARLLEEQPEIIQNVPLRYIASYLGITDTSLSRIRKGFVLG